MRTVVACGSLAPASNIDRKVASMIALVIARLVPPLAFTVPAAPRMPWVLRAVALSAGRT